ncbi:hypothetical protein AB5I41_24435 [Sphingomonas sp. MMS24-JH45]
MGARAISASPTSGLHPDIFSIGAFALRWYSLAYRRHRRRLVVSAEAAARAQHPDGAAPCRRPRLLRDARHRPAAGGSATCSSTRRRF